jgi:hypothetical protein
MRRQHTILESSDPLHMVIFQKGLDAHCLRFVGYAGIHWFLDAGFELQNAMRDRPYLLSSLI